MLKQKRFRLALIIEKDNRPNVAAGVCETDASKDKPTCLQAEKQGAEKQGNEKQGNKKSIVKYAKVISGILAVFPVAGSVLNYFCNFKYQMSCESFYHIPGTYFSTSINRSLIYTILIIVLIGLPFFLMWLERKMVHSRWSRIYLDCIAIIYGVAIPTISLSALSATRAFQTSWIEAKIYNVLDTCPAFILPLLIAAGVLLLLLVTRISRIKSDAGQNAVAIIVAILMIINMAPLVWSTIRVTNLSPENKTKYEIVTNEEDDQYLVLAKKDDKVLVVKCDVKASNEYVFDSDEYWLMDEAELTYTYIHMQKPPTYKDLDEVETP